MHFLKLTAVIGIALLLPSSVFGHGGGLDKYGCHHDRQRGGYHCHRGGESSSSHRGGESSSSSSRRSSYSSDEDAGTLIIAVCVIIIVVGVVLTSERRGCCLLAVTSASNAHSSFLMESTNPFELPIPFAKTLESYNTFQVSPVFDWDSHPGRFAVGFSIRW